MNILILNNHRMAGINLNWSRCIIVLMWIYCLLMQLTFEQHGFELFGSIYMWIFSIVSTTVLHSPVDLVESTNVEEPLIWRANISYMGINPQLFLFRIFALLFISEISLHSSILYNLKWVYVSILHSIHVRIWKLFIFLCSWRIRAVRLLMSLVSLSPILGMYVAFYLSL